MAKIEFYNIDCIEFMKTKPDNYYDLAIVDPPYGIDADNKNNGKNSDRHEKTSMAKINTYKTQNFPQYEKSFDDLFSNLGLPFFKTKELKHQLTVFFETVKKVGIRYIWGGWIF